MPQGLEVGRQLAGYRILGVLGQGGMGVVYESEHVVLGRKAAFKTLVPGLLDDEEFRERLIRESRMVAALDHPTVIPIYDAGEVEGIIFVAMRLVQGSDLAQLLEREGRLDLETTVTVLGQVAGALDVAHASGLVHRDVKPANVLLEEETGRVYLTDFGIAKQARSRDLTRTGYFLGTLDYAAPEQIEGKPIGPPADVYAFGCMLYECLTGLKPFGRSTAAATVRAHLLEPAPSVSSVVDLPPRIDEIVARALAKAEEDRFESCRGLVAALREASGGASTRGPSRGTAFLRTLPQKAAPVAQLPAESMPLFGRDAELAQLVDLIGRHDVRLVTLTGLGGTGKSRLALAAAHAVSDRFDGVVFADLASVQAADGVGPALADALGVDLGDRPVVETIAWRLAGRPFLLFLDNFERVLPAASLLADLQSAAPTLTILVTSQGALHLRTEHQFPLLPLPLPDPGAGDDLASLAAAPAVALFVHEARSVKRDFELTPENAEAVVAICARLDGLPLAIELAAARVGLLTPQAIIARLDRRLDFLTDAAGALPERQRTLRNAIDWTYELLEERERVLLARLSVFVGGWTLEAAETVCGVEAVAGIGVTLNDFASLVDKSLVRQREGFDGEPRFAMLETIREYALDRLQERGELDELRRRHAERYVALAEAAEPDLTASHTIWLDRLEEERENFRAAMAWSLDAGQVEVCLRLAGSLIRFWSIRGVMDDERRRLDRALAVADGIADSVLAKASFAAGYAALGEGAYEDADGYFERSLSAARSAGDRAAEGAALAQLAWVARARGRQEPAQEAAERALVLAEEAGDKVSMSGAYSVLAEIAADADETEEATRLFEHALRLRRELGDRRLIASTLIHLARRELPQANRRRTTALLGEGEEIARAVGDTWSISLALSTSATLKLLERDVARAARLFGEALELAHQRGDRRLGAECLLGLAATQAEDEPRKAARLLGAARALREGADATASSVETVIEELIVPPLREKLGEEYAAEEGAGALLDPENAIVLALEEGRAAAAL